MCTVKLVATKMYSRLNTVKLAVIKLYSMLCTVELFVKLYRRLRTVKFIVNNMYSRLCRHANIKTLPPADFQAEISTYWETKSPIVEYTNFH